MKKHLQLFTVLLALIFAVACTQPETKPDKTPPADAKDLKFAGAARSLVTGGALNLPAQTKLREAEFLVTYEFAAGKWESGLDAVLYLGDALIVEAEITTDTTATFGRLSTDKNLLTGGNLILKFRDGSNNLSTGTVLLADKTAPTIGSAALNGTTLTLTMSEALAGRGAISGNGGFALRGTVTTGTATNFAVTEVAAVAADARELKLTVTGRPQAGETVKLTYTQPAEGGQIKDKVGNALASDSTGVTVTGTPAETTPPTVTAAVLTNQTTVTVTLSEALAARTAAITGTGGFALTGTPATGTGAATTFTVTNVAAVAADATTVVLTITGTPKPNEVVKLTYTQPAEADRIKDKAGNALASDATGFIVTGTPEDTTAPTLASATLTNPTTVTLTLSEALAERTPITAGGGGFALTGTPATGTGAATTFTVIYVAAVAADAATVVLTITGTPKPNEVVKLTYTQPAEADRIRDTGGNALATNATGVTVTGTPEDTTAPADANAVTTIKVGDTTYSDQSATDKVLNKADETAVRAATFKVSYTFADATPFEDGSTAVLYQNATLVATATTTAATLADFAALAANLTSGTDLTLKFKDAANNVSTGVKAAEVDTEAPGAPTDLTIEDVTTTDRYINLADIDGATDGDVAGIDVTFTLTPAVVAGDTVTVIGFGAGGKQFDNISGNKVTMAKDDLSDGPDKRISVQVTDAAGNAGPSSGAVTVTVDKEAPTVGPATVSANARGSIRLTLTEFVAGTLTEAGGFTVARTAAGAAPVTVTAVVVHVRVITLTLSRDLADSETGVTLSYSATAEKIVDAAGNPLADFSDKVVLVY